MVLEIKIIKWLEISKEKNIELFKNGIYVYYVVIFMKKDLCTYLYMDIIFFEKYLKI